MLGFVDDKTMTSGWRLIGSLYRSERTPDAEISFGEFADCLTTFLVAEQIEKASRP